MNTTGALVSVMMSSSSVRIGVRAHRAAQDRQARLLAMVGGGT